MNKYKVGDKVKVTDYTKSNHNWDIGTRVEITKLLSSTSHHGREGYYVAKSNDGRTYNIYGIEMKATLQTKEAFQERLEELEKEKEELKTKIEWMELNKVEEFNEEEFTMYKLVDSLDPKVSKLEQARNIYKLFRGSDAR